jgi:hypothetical protein
MATLTNPINKQNIVDRFADYVVATGNSGITWGTNARPSEYFTTTYLGFEPFGGTTSGKGIETSAANITDANVTAATIYNVLVAETQRYSNIRNMRALINVTGAGNTFGTGTRIDAGPIVGSNPGIIYDVTAKAYLSTAYRQATISPANAGVAAAQVARSANLESFYNNLRTTYSTYGNTTATIQVNVCHSSCHTSCHANRGRR